MTITWKIYADAGLTIETDPVAFAHAQGGAGMDRLVYLGSNASAKRLDKASDPGTDAVELSLYNTTPGSGLDTTDFTLALSSGDLDTNTPGAALAMGVTLLSGIGDAVPVFIRAHSAEAIGAYSNIKLRLVGVVETEQ